MPMPPRQLGNECFILRHHLLDRLPTKVKELLSAHKVKTHDFMLEQHGAPLWCLSVSVFLYLLLLWNPWNSFQCLRKSLYKNNHIPLLVAVSFICFIVAHMVNIIYGHLSCTRVGHSLIWTNPPRTGPVH